MQSTLAFAPTEDDLEEFYFDLPVIWQSASGAKPHGAVDLTAPAPPTAARPAPTLVLARADRVPA